MVTLDVVDVVKVSGLVLVDFVPVIVDIPVPVPVPVSVPVVTAPPPPVEPTTVAVIVSCVLGTAPCTPSQTP